MENATPLMAVLASDAETEFAHQLAAAMGSQVADIVMGTPQDAAFALATRATSPRFILIDIGHRGADTLPELDAMAEQCAPGTRVVVIGTVNDIMFYRALRARGVIEYFPKPARVSDVREAFISVKDDAANRGKVIAVMGAASGDGGSTVALNSAYALATAFGKSTVLVDMDYQFGMVAKNLDLSSPYGVREVLEHPERGIDATLIDRMVVKYREQLQIIAAPHELRTLPSVPPELIRDMLNVLRSRYDVVVVDLPHVWTPWTAAAIATADVNVLVAQLWLRSVTHASRLLRAWAEVGVDTSNVQAVINRSGAKFKEAVSLKDFERVCGIKANHFLANDIRSVVGAENQGCTVLELAPTLLQRQLRDFAGSLIGVRPEVISQSPQPQPARSLFARLGQPS